MKILLMTYGTMGDVQPFVALALSLQEEGHEVRLAAPNNFENYVKSFGLSYYRYYGDTKEMLESETGKRWMASGNVKQFMKYMDEFAHAIRYERQKDLLIASEGVDAIISHILGVLQAAVLSEKLQIPYMMMYPAPYAPITKAFPNPLVTTKKLPFSIMNAWTHQLFMKLYEKGKEKDTNEWRIKLGLEPIKSSVFRNIEKQNTPILHTYSTNLVPKPKEWGEANIITGQINIPEKYKKMAYPSPPPQSLIDWLKDGPPPIYFGFGSLPVLRPQEMIDMAVQITKELRTRSILCAGWSEMSSAKELQSNDVYYLQSIDHEWLFPQCSMIIHHGGTGTTHTSLSAGVPSIICSTYADQPFWGGRLKQYQVGDCIPFVKLSKETLLASIKSLQNDKVKRNARALGEKLSKENGLEDALAFINKKLATASIYKN